MRIGVIAMLLLVCASLAANATGREALRMILSAPLTHSDWMMHSDAPAWGPEGIRPMLERCKSCGWKRVYWRVFDAGRSLCSSRLLEPMKYDTSPAPNCLTTGGLASQAPPDLVARATKLDYHGFDTLARKLGARQMLFWEADYIDARPQPVREQLMKAMSGAAR